MSRKISQPSFQEVLNSLRNAQFDVKDVPGAPGKVMVSKHGCATILHEAAGHIEPMATQPGFLVGGEISRILDRGNQKFLKTSKLEVPATADALHAVHLFTEELKQITGGISLYNESLGTVSDRYVYDRLKGRDLPPAQRPKRPWELVS
ncbi:MAG TPA: hypothetical protein VM554_11580 [Acidisarcina sp.]|nr:hypothetical protein [Acidisarcina sp.]